MNRLMIGAAALLAAAPLTALAQDAHYWTHQYGTRSALMGGAVVGGVRDTSAFFYNPGALGFIDNPSLSISANAYRYESTEIDDGAGSGEDLDSSEVNVVPLIVSGVHKFEGLPNHVLGYGIVTRQSHSFHASARAESRFDVLTNPFQPGVEDYLAQFTQDTDLNEYWGGLSWGYRVNENVSIGLSNMLSLRNQDFSYVATARAVNVALPNFTPGVSDVTSNFDYYSLNLLWKAGISADYGDWKFGLVATSPSVNLMGDGTIGGDISVINLDLDADGLPDSVVGNDRQEDLDAEYRTPAALAAGIEYAASADTTIGATVEWFGGQGAYNVMVPEARDFVRPIGSELINSSDFLLLRDAADSVVNYSIGVEQKLSDTWKGYLSFRTDFEARQDSSDLGTTDWDIYHITVGAARRGENSELGFGLVFSTAWSSDFAQPVNFSEPTEGGALFSQRQFTDADYTAVSLILGYTYFIE